MKTKMIIILTFLLLQSISGLAQKVKSEVFIISTIHRAHEINPNYSYDSLFAFIEKLNPDILGVEIRKEDIDSSASYIKSNYPYEMYECIERYSSKKVLGFDWLGEDISGKAIPTDYWKETSNIKILQQKLSKDSILLQRLSILDIIKEEKHKLALNASLQEINDGRYDLINFIYYEQLMLLLEDTEFKVLSDFYKKRDELIAQNILEIIKNNNGKKMLFLIGADHRDFTLKKVSEKFEGTILLNQF